MHPLGVKGKIRGEPFSNDENKNVVEINFQEKKNEIHIQVFSKKHSDEREVKNFEIENEFLDFFFCGNVEFGFLSPLR